MKKFEGMLLACDMDGTLLDDDKQISDENIRALRYFTEQGGLFSLATGRAFAAVTDYTDVLPINAPYSLLNGSLVHDANHRPLYCAGMPDITPHLIQEILHAFPQIGCEVFLPDRILICRMSAESEYHMRVLHLQYDCVPLSDLPDPSGWCQINFTGEASEVASVRTYLEQYADVFHAVCTVPTFCEVTRRGVSKGTAMLRIAANCQISAEHIFAAGDSDNDLSMLHRAAISFVPNNATPDILQQGTITVRDNNHDAVVQIIAYLDKQNRLTE